MSKDNKTKGSIDKWISIATVMFSIVALILSWQANRIASQQASAHVVVIGTTWKGGGYRQIENGQQATCSYIIRFTNLGGISTALIGYEVEVFYGDAVSKAESSFSTLISPQMMMQYNATSPRIGNFEFYLFPGNSQIDFPNPTNSNDFLVLPYQITSYTTLDIQIIFNLISESGAVFDNPSYYSLSGHEGFIPISVIYTFKTSTGQEINVPQSTCWYVK